MEKTEKMPDENQNQGPGLVRQSCCRLCLAPEVECISIFNSYAADREPLAVKIFNCVDIKISQKDRLSLRICHACISYLNSWQSFKNRSLAAQCRQRSWLRLDKQKNTCSAIIAEAVLEEERNPTPMVPLNLPITLPIRRRRDSETINCRAMPSGSVNAKVAEGATSAAGGTSFEGIDSLRRRRSLTVYQLPEVRIKNEPEEYEEDYKSDEMVVDPSMFLEQNETEGADQMDHSAYQQFAGDGAALPADSTMTPTNDDLRVASCRACNLKFSTRANARRHERNLHPNLFELYVGAPNATPITKPKPALAAALESQQRATVPDVEANVSPQKYRQEIVNIFNQCDASVYDYDNPEKYQTLLTDEKIVFIQQNQEFLQQYQTMTCRCCNKFYSTYKNFMAHMRKKYETLPRNLCFSCLKLNDSKALFISHLKKRNCINLCKVLHTLMTKSPTFAAAVSATVAAAPEKLRAKELLVNKMYECKLCPKHFRLKLEFRSHVYEKHLDATIQKRDLNDNQCNFCGLEIEDPVERKRHYNNMDCIVNLRCVTCDAKFDKHQRFLDHVYERHLNSFGECPAEQPTTPPKHASFTEASQNGNTSLQPKSQYFSRMPQACPICGQQYNNYNNVLRHMESKHPDQLPQTYKCVKCSAGYPRLSNLREHMVAAHSADKVRHTGFEYIVNADAVKIVDGGTPSVYSGRYDYVMKDLMSIANGGANVDGDEDEVPESAAKKARLDTSEASATGANNTNNSNMFSSLKECAICSAVFSNNIGLSNHMRSHNQSAAAAAAAGGKVSANTPQMAHSTPTAPSAAAAAETPPVGATFTQRSLEQAADRRFRRMRCRICQRRFSSKKSYRFHMLNDHQVRNVQFIKCKICGAEFAYEKGLKVHMFKIHNTLLKDDMIIKQFECDICSIVYRTEDQLLLHKKSVHGNENAHPQDFAEEPQNVDTSSAGGGTADHSGISTPEQRNVTVEPPPLAAAAAAVGGPLYWYQCKYCPSNFNTNKKLAIHINSHDEFDSKDYSCKDCGNVYSGRKSLWVHRYKKHPQIPKPSECTLCKKVFFDGQMLEHHIPTCNRKPITATGAQAAETTTNAANPPKFRHKTGDDDEEDDMGTNSPPELHDDTSHRGLGGVDGGGALPKIVLPEIACTICQQRFTDQELLLKHIQMHEMELYTDNPLAAMFDTGPADPNQFFLDRLTDNGQFACDLCSKTFAQITALKVHRKWHFRGDSKQNQLPEAVHSTDSNSTSLTQPNCPPHLLGSVGLIPRTSATKPTPPRTKRELKCEFCPSTFISNNNLRRHIYELHKSQIGNNLPQAPKILLDPPLKCRRCEIVFKTRQEWIDHKLADARIMKPFGPFQWGCDLCGVYVSRKEKLLTHIGNHLKEETVASEGAERGGRQEPNKTALINGDAMEEDEEEEDEAIDEEMPEKNESGEHDSHVREEEESNSKQGLDEAMDEGQEEEDEEEEEEEDADESAEAQNEEQEEQCAEEEDEGEGGRADYEESEGAVEDDDDDEEGEEEEPAEDDDEEEDEEERSGPIVNMNENANDGQSDPEEGSAAEDGEEEEEDDEDEDNDAEGGEEGRAVLIEDSQSGDASNESQRTPRNLSPQGEEEEADTSEAEDSQSVGDAEENEAEAAEDDDDDEEDDDDEVGEEEEEGRNYEQNARETNDADSDDDEYEDNGASHILDSDDSRPHTPISSSRYSCDLCQVYFDTQPELQKHVTMHFLNGPMEIKPKSRAKSRSSSGSDVMSVLSS